MDGSKITRLIVGAITVAMGAMGVLSGVGVLPHGRVDPTVPVAQQRALAVCAGAVFAAGGASAMLTAFAGRWTRRVNTLLGLVIALGLTALFAWVALGPGARGFSSPLAILGPHVNAVSGRITFGLCALLGLATTVLMVRGIVRPASSPTD